MARELLKDSSGNRVEVDEGESAKATVTFQDLDNASLATASISTLTVTIRNAADGTIINSRDGQNIKNANGGTLSDVGGAATLEFILTTADNAAQDVSEGETEYHWVDFVWTWSDGAGTRTGKAAYKYPVRGIANAASGVGYLG